ncbi:hypothetical protein [Furfurilactobacillus siliginis]|uniref:Uncharacterized protein n=1 Tax=Furfurilactobacillus siliginis TaxID=348151 RepID=A0A0R2LAK6_9LACO|nr:hypothetical protein [Furfurilactobacillus siliginis]KRN96170.1 hypothetical protein IV55_GL001556 [Furfurilactobacillus siliginis]GEK27905.1 hypothetical protein LSI01_02160 [Furfurilactobacillus siliginis]
MSYALPLSKLDKQLLHTRNLRAETPLQDVTGLAGLHLDGLLNGVTFDATPLLNDAFVCLLEVNLLTSDYAAVSEEKTPDMTTFATHSQQLHDRLAKVMSRFETQVSDFQLLHDQVRANFYAAEPDDLAAKVIDGRATDVELAFHTVLGMSADAQWLLETGLQILRRFNPALPAQSLQSLSAEIMSLVED